MPPQSMMNNLESMTTYAGIVDDKVTAMGVRVNKVEVLAKASAQLGVFSEVTINNWIGEFGAMFEGLIQKSINMMSAQVFPWIIPLELSFASHGPSGVPICRHCN